MSYTPHYPGYQPMYYQPPMPDQLSQLRGQQFQPPVQGPQAQPQPQPASTGIIWVQGEEGAKGYLVAPGENRLFDGQRKTQPSISNPPMHRVCPCPCASLTTRSAQRPGQPNRRLRDQASSLPPRGIGGLSARLDALAEQKQAVKEEADHA